jgi:rhodanese-related sulfurtransferase
MTTKYLLVAFVGMLVAWILFRQQSGGVASERAAQIIHQGGLLLDVRTPSEFAAAHLDGAINIPVYELAARAKELGSTERPVVVYCQSGSRSAAATTLLNRAGFHEVYDLGAMSRWKARPKSAEPG